MNHQEIFEKALRAVEPMWELRQAVKKLLDEGADRSTLLTELDDFRLSLEETGRDADTDIALTVIAHMVGYCHPRMIL